MMRVYPEVRAIAPNCPEEKENLHGDSGFSHKGKFFYTGYQGCPVSRLREHNSRETEAAAVAAAEQGPGACGYDPAVRVRFQEEAGIEAEVMNPTSMLSILS